MKTTQRTSDLKGMTQDQLQEFLEVEAQDACPLVSGRDLVVDLQSAAWERLRMLGDLDSAAVSEAEFRVLMMVGQMLLSPQLSHSDNLVLWYFLKLC